jgi:hypothetical protein
MEHINILKTISIACLSVISLGFTCCDDYLREKDLPRLTPDYYGTSAGVEAAATATYSYMRWGAGSLERYNSMTEYGTDLFTQVKILGCMLMPLINMGVSKS